MLYTVVHEAFIAALTPALATHDASWSLTRRNQQSSSSTTDEPFLCFQRQARGDVLLIPPKGEASARPDPISPQLTGSKILGSAQRRHRGAILQHGSLLLEKSPAAPELAGIRDLTGPDIAIREIAATVGVRLKDALGGQFVESPLPRELESKAHELTNTKYGSPAWTKRR
jgi:lipoate-protein ligase A